MAQQEAHIEKLEAEIKEQGSRIDMLAAALTMRVTYSRPSTLDYQCDICCASSAIRSAIKHLLQIVFCISHEPRQHITRRRQGNAQDHRRGNDGTNTRPK